MSKKICSKARLASEIWVMGKIIAMTSKLHLDMEEVLRE